MNSSRALALGCAGAAIVLALVIIVFARKDFAHDPAFAGTPVQPPRLATDAVLVDARGRHRHLVDSAYAAQFVFFGYTHCPDECPLALANLSRAYRTLSPAAKKRTRIVFVTVDPGRDTSVALGRYVAHFDSHIVAFTGSHAALAPVWNAYGIDVAPQGRELVGHGGMIYALDATGHIVLLYPPDVSATDLSHDATALTAAHRGPI